MQLLVTGAYRSGTTLTDKLLHQHPDLSVAGQPFPYLYIGAKRRFLRSLGYDDHYPLGSVFLETRYGSDDLRDFVADDVLDPTCVTELVEENRGYSGALTPELYDVADSLGSGTLFELAGEIHGRLAVAFGRPAATWTGAKEILVEEYVPLALDAGWSVIQLIRDPRAVVASLTTGIGQQYGGELRPTLFHLRNWRKSAAVALSCSEHPRHHTLGYEQILAGGARLPDAVWEFLGVGSAPEGDLYDQQGVLWRDNSSFAHPTAGSADPLRRALDALDDPTLRFIEACTWPELLALGYETVTDAHREPSAILDFVEPHAILRSPPVPDLSVRRSQQEVELRRQALLVDGDCAADDPIVHQWFYSRACYDRLRAVA